MNILLLFIIGVSLSMDTFSLALSMGSFNIKKKVAIIFSFFVAFFHFFMPIIGRILGSSINKLFIINPNKVLFIIFIFIAIGMILDILSKNDKDYNTNIFSIIIYAFSVSIDSLMVGIGIDNITNFPIFGSLMFSFLSFFFTILGIIIGKYSYSRLGNLSKYFGLIIIILLAILHYYK